MQNTVLVNSVATIHREINERKMDKFSIGKPFKVNDYVTYPCPSCGRSSLKLNKEKFYAKVTSESHNLIEILGSDTELIKEVFTAVLVCENHECEEVVVCSGTGYVEMDITVNDRDEQIQEYFSYYIPKVFIPPLQYIDIPTTCPSEVYENLQEAFSLTLLSPSSAANKVRMAIENLLSEYNIPKYKLIKRKGKSKRERCLMSLHERITIAAHRKKTFGKLDGLLFAVKWLGNEGSHAASGLTQSDLFDAYRLTEHILNVLYPSGVDLQKRALEIVKNKGVKKRKRSHLKHQL